MLEKEKHSNEELESIDVDLVDEIDKYINGINPVFGNEPIPRNLFNDCIIAAAHHFAEWQREKDIKLDKIDDLEEFAQIWAYSNYYKELDEINCDSLYSGVKKGAKWYENKMKEALQTEYEKGRFDMREEMVKNAVGGKVVYQIGSAEIAPTDIQYKVLSDKVFIPNVKLGDRVKILIIKP